MEKAYCEETAVLRWFKPPGGRLDADERGKTSVVIWPPKLAANLRHGPDDSIIDQQERWQHGTHLC